MSPKARQPGTKKAAPQAQVKVKGGARKTRTSKKNLSVQVNHDELLQDSRGGADGAELLQGPENGELPALHSSETVAPDTPAPQEQNGVGLQDGDEPQWRQAAADRARKRAAHFAYFKGDSEEEEEGNENAHTGGSAARRLGPWSTAMDLVNARADAVEARKNRLALGTLDSADEGIEWKPSRDPGLGPRPQQTVDTLFRSCIELLVEYIDDVDSLWGIPEIIKIQLGAALSKHRKLSPRVVSLMTEGNPDEVVLPDCTQLKEEELLSALSPAMTDRLQRLELNLCGRGFSDKLAKAIVQKGDLSKLKVLALGGAYRLTDDGLLTILKACPDLEELHLPQCSRIEGQALEQLPQMTPKLVTLNLTDCRGLSSTALRNILCESDSARNLDKLEAVSLDSVAELDDPLLTDICVSLSHLARLSLRNCSGLTDAGLKGVAAGCGPRLTELHLDDVSKITDEALFAISQSCPKLQVVSLRLCGKVTDAGMAALASAGQIRILGADHVFQLTNLTVKALIATCSEHLEEANFSWCRNITSNALGLLAESCTSLRKLVLFGCSQSIARWLCAFNPFLRGMSGTLKEDWVSGNCIPKIGTDFLHGHSNECLDIIGAPQEKLAPVEKMRMVLSLSQDEEAE